MKYIYLLLLTLSFNCYSQNPNYDVLRDDFTYLGKSNKNDVYYKIEERIELGHQIKLWIKTIIPSKSYKNKKGKIVKPKNKYTMTYMTMYCSSKTYSLEDYVNYNGDGSVINSGNSNSFMEKIFPNSIAENLFNEICN